MKDPHSPSASDLITRHLRIIGRVQGVGYRWNMAQQAELLGVNGWVRNCSDGSVEAVVCGPIEAVQKLVAWAKQGPDGAQVDGVSESGASGNFVRFEQRETT